MAHVVVIGAGYAGLAARRNAHHGGAHVTLIEGTSTHQLLPRLAAVAAGVQPATDAAIDLADLPAGRTVHDHVVRIDHARRKVHTADGTVVSYDALVVTTGASRTMPQVEGVATHAMFLRNVSDALALRTHLDAEPARRLIVVGGGPTGVQMAADVAGASDRRVALVEAEPQVLPSFPAHVGGQAEQQLGRLGVHVHHGHVERVTANGVALADGTFLPGTVVWAASMPTGGNELLPDARLTEGRLAIDYAQRVTPRVFAAGDVAAQLTMGGTVLPKSAQVAVRAGALAGANAAAVANGRRAKTKAFTFKGAVVPIGPRGGVTDVPVVGRLGPATRLLVPAVHWVLDVLHLGQVGGLPTAFTHRPHHATPSAAPRPAERPSQSTNEADAA